jgi:hypothetical protein
MVDSGELEPTDLLWKLGMKEWRPAGESATLFGREEARAANRRRSDAAIEPRRRRTARESPAAAIGLPLWIGKRPLLTSIGIGAGAGILISAVVASALLLFDWTAETKMDAAVPAVPVAVVAPPAQPVKVKPVAAKPTPASPVVAEPAAAEALAVVTAPIAPDRAQTDPPADPQPDTLQPGLPTDLQTESPPNPGSRIRVLLPDEDF